MMFQRELEIYELEGVQGVFDNIEAVANRAECIELFTKLSKPPGIIKQLADMTIQKGNSDKDVSGSFIVSTFNTFLKDTHNYTVCTPTNVREAVRLKEVRWRKP